MYHSKTLSIRLLKFERSKIVYNIVIPGSSENSDLGASVSVIKSKLKTHLLEKLGTRPIGNILNFIVSPSEYQVF